MIFQRRVDLQKGRDAALIRTANAFSGEVIVAFHDRVDAQSIHELADSAPRGPAEEAMLEEHRTRVQLEARRGLPVSDESDDM